MRLAATLLVLLGLAQIVADLAHAPALKALAAATQASPAPRVFSTVNGLETFSPRFSLAWHDREGRERTLAIDPLAQARLRGPYNRRNVYGAVLAYGPILRANERTRPMLEAVARYALCGDAPLLRELGIEPAEIAGPLRVRTSPREGARTQGLELEWEVECP